MRKLVTACLTAENIILVILIRFSTNLYQTLQAVIVHKCVNEIFVILHKGANITKMHVKHTFINSLDSSH